MKNLLTLTTCMATFFLAVTPSFAAERTATGVTPNQIYREKFLAALTNAYERNFFQAEKELQKAQDFITKSGRNIARAYTTEGNLRYWANDQLRIRTMLIINGGFETAMNEVRDLSNKDENNRFSKAEYLWSFIKYVIGFHTLLGDGIAEFDVKAWKPQAEDLLSELASMYPSLTNYGDDYGDNYGDGENHN